MSKEIGLPKGWVSVPLSVVLAPRRVRVSPEDYVNLPFIGMEHVEAHSMKILGTVPAATMRSSALRFEPGDVLYGRLRPYLNKVAQPGVEGLCSAEFIVFPDSPTVRSSFLKYRLNAADFVNFATHLNEGDRPRVDIDQIGHFTIWLPQNRNSAASFRKSTSCSASSMQA